MVTEIPTINASLNLLSTILLVAGFIAIKKKKVDLHKKLMVTALVSSVLFLICYLLYHYQVGSVPYPRHDWTRPIYFAILIPHVVLAAVMTPFIGIGVFYAAKKNFRKHKKIMRGVWPVWLFVSVTGVIVYLMLYR